MLESVYRVEVLAIRTGCNVLQHMGLILALVYIRRGVNMDTVPNAW